MLRNETEIITFDIYFYNYFILIFVTYLKIFEYSHCVKYQLFNVQLKLAYTN